MSYQKVSFGKTLALTGAFLQLGPVIGFAGTAIAMMRAFDTLAVTGVSDEQRLSANIGEAMVATAVGIIFSVIGIILLCIALFGCRYRSEWFFWFLVIYGGLLLISFPIGTVVGIVFIVFCITHRNEFLKPNKPVQGV